jgi:hypothetical protein
MALIKCIPPIQDKFATSLKSLLENPIPFIKHYGTQTVLSPRDSIFGLVGRRAGALFFARHRDYFIVIRNFVDIYLDLVLFRSFTMTLGYSAVYRSR